MPDTLDLSRQRKIVAAAAFVLVGIVTWLWIASGVQHSQAVAAAQPSAETPRPTAALQRTVEAVDAGRWQASVRSELGVAPAAFAERHAVPAAANATVTLLARFVRPDGSKLKLERARIELRDEFDAVHATEVQHSESVRVRGLAPGRYTVRVDATGLLQREQFLDLTRQVPSDRSAVAESVCDERLLLWPANWVAVVVETSAGRSLSALAEELGHDPASLYVGAFEARARCQPARAEDGPLVDAPPLARFHPPSGYKSWELPDRCVGSLEFLQPPPAWVGLDLLGGSVGWELLQPGRSEIVFHIDRAALEQRLARVAVRVVDRDSSLPVERALVTLRADTSAHRRADLNSVPSDSDGRVEFVDVVSGRYELTIARGESEHQQRIELRPAERRDLGDIAIGDREGIDVLVLDEAGRPVLAYLEIGPYEKGRTSAELYPRLLRHRTDRFGRLHLPRPTGRAIVRATREAGRNNGVDTAQELTGARSANVLLDPDAAPVGPLRLVLFKPCAVQISTRQRDGARIEVLDELDLVVGRSARADVRELELELVPGLYRARCLTPAGVSDPERPFVVDRTTQRIQVD